MAGKRRGVTLIDTIVGSALMLVVFLGIAAVFQLSVDVVTNNKARAGAIALGGERMEYVRSLAYDSIGTVGGIPSGAIAQIETVISNSIPYTRRTVVQYVDDPQDGTGAADSNSITVDYKIVKVDVAWTSRTGARHIAVVTRVSPPNGMEIACPPSAQCGTLAISVVNAATVPVANAQVHIVNTTTNPVIDLTTYTNDSGAASLPGAPVAVGYEVTVTKEGYSTDKTYNPTAQNTNPSPGPLTVANNQTTSSTFRIDLVSNLTIKTYTLNAISWTDSFNNESKIGSMTNAEISGNQLRFEGNQPYLEPADVKSVVISPNALSRWGTFSWNDTRPSETQIAYRVYFENGGDIAILPDTVLPGNSTGFITGTSVDLSVIPAATYPSLVLDAVLTALNPNAPSPSIQDWSLSYQSGGTVNATLSLRGAKTIGSGPGGTVYKYNNTSIASGAGGSVMLTNLEWDSYTTSVLAANGYDVASSCTPQPVYLAPNTSLTTQLFFAPHTANSLLVDVKNNSGALLSGATVHLTKGGSYDKTIIADACGQSFFDTLTNGNYSIEVSYPGNETHTGSGIDVSGTSRLSVVLN